MDSGLVSYQDGVYTPAKLSKWWQKGDYRPLYQQINHYLIIFGWGIEKGKQYWLVMNSYGNAWGDNGVGKIERGRDINGIESHALWGVVSLQGVGEKEKAILEGYQQIDQLTINSHTIHSVD